MAAGSHTAQVFEHSGVKAGGAFVSLAERGRWADSGELTGAHMCRLSSCAPYSTTQPPAGASVHARLAEQAGIPLRTLPPEGAVEGSEEYEIWSDDEALASSMAQMQREAALGRIRSASPPFD